MEIFLGRQAIYNRNREIIAYELLYRNSLTNEYDDSITGEEATYAVIENILSMGLNNIISNKMALINCEEQVLLSDAIYLLPKNSIIIEVLETVKATNTVLERLKELKNIGFQLALDDVIDVESINEFKNYISIVKIDYSLTDSDTIEAITKIAKKNNIKVLAEKIETEEEFIRSLELGIEYFQGYYFSKPSILKGKNAIIVNNIL